MKKLTFSKMDISKIMDNLEKCKWTISGFPKTYRPLQIATDTTDTTDWTLKPTDWTLKPTDSTTDSPQTLQTAP